MFLLSFDSKHFPRFLQWLNDHSTVYCSIYRCFHVFLLPCLFFENFMHMWNASWPYRPPIPSLQIPAAYISIFSLFLSVVFYWVLVLIHYDGLYKKIFQFLNIWYDFFVGFNDLFGRTVSSQLSCTFYRSLLNLFHVVQLDFEAFLSW